MWVFADNGLELLAGVVIAAVLVVLARGLEHPFRRQAVIADTKDPAHSEKANHEHQQERQKQEPRLFLFRSKALSVAMFCLVLRFVLILLRGPPGERRRNRGRSDE